MSSRAVMIVLYILTLLAVGWILYTGGHYYLTPLIQRPHLDQHEFWKANGLIGHGLGILGSIMILLLLGYVLRKDVRWMQTWGNLRNWLNVHMWMGITAPILITFHSTGKVGGIVAISYWSMVAVALSGFLGRYIYIQIPRSLSGHELSLGEIEDWDRAMVEAMKKTGDVDDELIERIQRTLGDQAGTGRPALAVLFGWVFSDLSMPFRLLKLRAELRRAGKIGRDELNRLINLARKRAVLRRRMAFLRRAQKALHYWHVIHRPFALIMLVIMLVHVTVAWLFGYRWIF